MEKTFDPKTIEQHCYAHWEAQGYFSPTGEGKAFSIMLPPPMSRVIYTWDMDFNKLSWIF